VRFFEEGCFPVEHLRLSKAYVARNAPSSKNDDGSFAPRFPFFGEGAGDEDLLPAAFANYNLKTG
jgi:hypothetical protein